PVYVVCTQIGRPRPSGPRSAQPLARWRLRGRRHAAIAPAAGFFEQCSLTGGGRMSRSEAGVQPSGRSRRSAVSTAALLAAVGWLIAAGSVAAQESDVVAGVVVDARTLQPLAGVQISVEGTTTGTVTDASGRFRLQGLTGTSVVVRFEI